MTYARDTWMVPGKDLVLAACRGLPHDTHPMLDAAGELTQLHEIRERTPRFELTKLDRRRVQLVRAVDRWITLTTPVPYESVGAHEETVGRLVDRLASLVAQASAPLRNAPEPVSYDAWVRVHDLADTYQDLVDGLRAGTCRMPETG